MAISILQPLAEAGLAEAQFQLGRLVLTECDLLTGRQGFEWLYAAAQQGHSEAQYRVATYPSFPNEPFESPLSSTTRWELLLSAAAAGITDAQYHAATCVATGAFGDDFSVPIDLSSALDWYRRASEAGHATAQFNLACMLLNGEGCARNRDEGMRWLESAAERGDEQARRFLVYLTGEPAE